MECLLLLISALRPGRVATPTSKIALRRCAPEDTLTSKTRNFLRVGPPCSRWCLSKAPPTHGLNPWVPEGGHALRHFSGVILPSWRKLTIFPYKFFKSSSSSVV